MDAPQDLALMFLLGGGLLMLAELILPGLVVIFLGAAGVVVGGLAWLGLMPSLAVALVVWFVLSVVAILFLRKALLRFFPSEKHFTPFDADGLAFGTVVEVLEAIPATGGAGRVRHEGTTWPAVSKGVAIAQGTHVKLVYRDNLAWVVEPTDAPLGPPK